MILLAYRHGLRVSELVALRWDQVDLREGRLQVNRVKQGTASVHFLLDPKLRALRKLEREEPTGGSYVFASERDGPLMAVGFWKPLAQAGAESTVDFPVHPHVPRHSCGYKLANDGHNIRAIQRYLGHKNIQHAVSYTELSAERFKGFGGIDPDLTSSMEVACYPPSTRVVPATPEAVVGRNLRHHRMALLS